GREDQAVVDTGLGPQAGEGPDHMLTGEGQGLANGQGCAPMTDARDHDHACASRPLSWTAGDAPSVDRLPVGLTDTGKRKACVKLEGRRKVCGPGGKSRLQRGRSQLLTGCALRGGAGRRWPA